MIIFATWFVGNQASQRVLEKIGIKYERFRRHVKESKDVDNYGLTVDNWRAGRL